MVNLILYFIPKERFWLGTHGAQTSIVIAVPITMMYYGKLAHNSNNKYVAPIQQSRCVQ